MAVVSYDNQAIIPGPYLSISKDYQTNDDGAPVGTLFNIVVKGKFVAHKGSPNSSGQFWTQGGYPPDEAISDVQRLASILRKQEALRKLFSNHGRTFDIQPWNGSPPITFNPRIKSIQFPEGQWYNVEDYIINMEADILYVNGTALYEDGADFTTYKVSKSSEDWDVEVADEAFLTYRLTHTVSAQGKRFFDVTGSLTQEAWQNARDYVQNKIGLGIDLTKADNSVLTPINNDYQAYNYVRGEKSNIKGGNYSVSETWLLYAPSGSAAIEEYVGATTVQENGMVEVSVEGTIKGLRISNNTTQATLSSKYTNALARFNEVQPSFFQRAQDLSGSTLNPQPLGKLISKAYQEGVITYNYKYNARPTTVVPGAISEKLTVTFDGAKDVLAIIPVLGRAAGPVLQNIGTITETRKNLTIEAIVVADSQAGPAVQPNTDVLVGSFTPTSSQVFKTQDRVSFNPRQGSYTREVSWVYQ